MLGDEFSESGKYRLRGPRRVPLQPSEQIRQAGGLFDAQERIHMAHRIQGTAGDPILIFSRKRRAGRQHQTKTAFHNFPEAVLSEIHRSRHWFPCADELNTKLQGRRSNKLGQGWGKSESSISQCVPLKGLLSPIRANTRWFGGPRERRTILLAQRTHLLALLPGHR